jgi:hypothetical protein
MAEEEKRSRLEKTDKQLRDGNFTTIKVSKNDLKLFDKYCKTQRKSKTDVLHEIISFLEQTNMPLSALKEKNDLHNMNILIKNYHNHTTGVLKNFENNFLTHLDTNNKDNLDFLHKTVNHILEFKTKENLISSQNFKLLRGLVSGLLEDKDANILLKETLSAIQEAVQTKTAVTKITDKEPFILEGIVGQNPKIEKSAKESKLYLLFTLAQKSAGSSQAIWHNAVLWEGQLTKQMQLNDEQAIKNYFSGIKTGDTLKLKGYDMEAKYKDKDQKDITKATYVVTEVISHEPKIKTTNQL